MSTWDRHKPRRNGATFEPDRERPISARAPLVIRLRVYLTRGRLDRQIASGRRCDSTAAMTVRASQLTHPRTLQRIARGLHSIVDYVDRLGSRDVFSAVVIESAGVTAGRQAILGLADRFEGPAPVSPRGVALAQLLLSDGLSPLFNQYSERTVTQAIWDVEDALEANASAPGFGAVSR